MTTAWVIYREQANNKTNKNKTGREKVIHTDNQRSMTQNFKLGRESKAKQQEQEGTEEESEKSHDENLIEPYLEIIHSLLR